jgi:hypothetical protein
MAVDQDNTSSNELDFQEETDAMYCTATKAKLIGTGKFKPEWFPGVKGNHRQLVTIENDALRAMGFSPLIAELKIARSEENRNIFDVQMIFTDEEAERRELIKRRGFDETVYKEGFKQAKKWIDELPDSVESFKKQSVWLIRASLIIDYLRFANAPQ